MSGDVLDGALKAGGIVLEAAVAARLARYMELVLTANAVQNLTALRSPQLFAAEGIVDSLLAWRAAEIPTQAFVDVGSGSGLPGLVWLLAGCAPHGTLVEAEGRKAEFLRAVVGELGVEADVEWGRAEVLARGARRDSAGVVSARAVASAPMAVEVAGGLVRPGGVLVLLKGPRAAVESVEAAPVAARMGFAPVTLRGYETPELGLRCAMVYRKLRATPAGRPVAYARLKREFGSKAGIAEREGGRKGE